MRHFCRFSHAFWMNHSTQGQYFIWQLSLVSSCHYFTKCVGSWLNGLLINKLIWHRKWQLSGKIMTYSPNTPSRPLSKVHFAHNIQRVANNCGLYIKFRLQFCAQQTYSTVSEFIINWNRWNCHKQCNLFSKNLSDTGCKKTNNLKKHKKQQILSLIKH